MKTEKVEGRDIMAKYPLSHYNFSSLSVGTEVKITVKEVKY